MEHLTLLLSIVVLASFINHSNGYAVVKGISVVKTNTGSIVPDLGAKISENSGNTLLIFSTYAADFNAIEYAQRLRHYLPKLKTRGIKNFELIMNASPEATKYFSSLLDLPQDISIYSDPSGKAGRAFGVSRGFQPDDLTNPYLKLFAMLFGLGAYATLPAVIGGYIGNPWSKQPWIQEALAEGQKAGRWPNNALEINTLETGEEVIVNKFDELPYVGDWGRRPLELATLRLQNMIGISLQHWSQLKPTEEELQNGLLTQLGGCVILDENMETKYEWKDAGICHVANFEDILRKLDVISKIPSV